MLQCAVVPVWTQPQETFAISGETKKDSYSLRHASTGNWSRPVTQYNEGFFLKSAVMTSLQNILPRSWDACSRHAWKYLDPVLDFLGSEMLATRRVSSSDWGGADGPTWLAPNSDIRGGILLTCGMCFFSWRFPDRFSFRESVTFRFRSSLRLMNISYNRWDFLNKASSSERSASSTDTKLSCATRVSWMNKELALDW